MDPWRPLVMVVSFVGLLFIVSPNGLAEQAQPKPVQLTIDYGDGFQKRYTSIPWEKKMTVLDTLEFAAEHPRRIRFKHRSSGSTAFLTSIDGLENEGGRGKNWIYWINEEQGDRSFAIRVLHAGDHVLWKFGAYE